MAKTVRKVSDIKVKSASQNTRSIAPNLNRSKRPKEDYSYVYLSGKTKGNSLGEYTLGLMKLD